MKKSEFEFRENCDLSRDSSARLPMLSRLAVYPKNENEIVKIITTADEYGVKYEVVGGMTNLIIKNGFYDGVIIKTDKIISKNLAENKLLLGCGVRMGSVIRKMASLGLGGMEGLAGIPGTVGGMVKQNAGAFGYEISDRFCSALCYFKGERCPVNLAKDDMRFDYRSSIFSDKGAVLISAEFDLIDADADEINDKIASFNRKRIDTQPIGYPSLGSVFKRYNGVSAGYYIDKSGLKGVTFGGAQISRKHAGFIVNIGGATADDFIRLIDYVKERVYSVFGIELEEEIEII